MAQRVQLPDLRVGEARSLRLDSYYASGSHLGEARNPTSGYVVGYDPDRETTGRADSATITTLVDATRTEANDFWNGLCIEVDRGGRKYLTEITDFVSATHTFTFRALPEAPQANDSYRVKGYPVLSRRAVTVSTNQITVAVGASDLLALPGDRVLVYDLVFGTETERLIARVRVLPPMDEE